MAISVVCSYVKLVVSVVLVTPTLLTALHVMYIQYIVVSSICPCVHVAKICLVFIMHVLYV